VKRLQPDAHKRFFGAFEEICCYLNRSYVEDIARAFIEIDSHLLLPRLLE